MDLHHLRSFYLCHSTHALAYEPDTTRLSTKLTKCVKFHFYRSLATVCDLGGSRGVELQTPNFHLKHSGLFLQKPLLHRVWSSEFITIRVIDKYSVNFWSSNRFGSIVTEGMHCESRPSVLLDKTVILLIFRLVLHFNIHWGISTKLKPVHIHQQLRAMCIYRSV